MPERQCEWDGKPLTGRTSTCGSACRGARWRWLKGISNDPPPWPGSPLHGRRGELAPALNPAPETVTAGSQLALRPVAAASTAEIRKLQQERNAATARADRLLARATTAEAARRSNGPRAGESARSGVTISYRKAVAAVQAALVSYVMASGASEQDARDEIEEALRDALPPAQRQKLEARDDDR